MADIRTYSHGVAMEEAAGLSAGYCVNGTIYISGQMSHDMDGNFVGEGDIEAQTRQTLDNLDRVLAGFGVTRSNLVDVQVFMTDVQRDHAAYNPIFKEYLGDHRPAATLIGVASLLGGPQQLIEIKAIAHLD